MTDNSLRTARSLGVLSNIPAIRRNLVGPRDRIDSYKFTINSSSSVKLNLSGLRSNADLVLFNGLGRQILRSSQVGNRPERIQSDLNAGTYYLQVRSKGNKTTSYRLRAAAIANVPPAPVPVPAPVPAPPPLEGTLSNPINLGTLMGGTITRSQDIASSTSPKYYKFQLANISDVNLTLSGVSQATNMRLYYDFNGNGIADNDESFETGGASSSSSNPISEALPATGTYFIRVDPSSFLSSASTVYDLLVATTPTPGNIPTDPGSDASTAYNLGTLSPGSRIEAKDYVGKLDRLDFYRFNVSTNTTVSFNVLDFTTAEGNYQSALYRDINNNGLIDDGERVTGLSRGEQVSLASGATYYVDIRQTLSEHASYTITLTA